MSMTLYELILAGFKQPGRVLHAVLAMHFTAEGLPGTRSLQVLNAQPNVPVPFRIVFFVLNMLRGGGCILLRFFPLVFEKRVW